MTKSPARHPLLYIMMLCLAVAAGYLYQLRTQGIFSCPAGGYRTDRYLAYCNGEAYSDYDHGAFWFGLEPGIPQNAALADVLFLGSSRMQFALSTVASDSWFASHSITHYLMGFSHTENATFAAPLLAQLKPRAKFYVINVDRFFSDVESGPGSEILHNPRIGRRYTEKRLWQQLHRRICTRFVAQCGRNFAYFRASETGHWVVRGDPPVDDTPVSESPASDPVKLRHAADLAERFISTLPVARECVLLTLIPSPGALTADARTIAAALNLELITPNLDGLRTFDGSHLDLPSAERWSQGFYALAGDRIRGCMAT